MRIKLFLLGLLFFGGASYGQDVKPKESQIDTVQLFDPKPIPGEFISAEMFTNCLLLNKKPFTLLIQGKEYEIVNYKELLEKITSEKLEIGKSRFFIWIDSSILFSQVVEIVGKLKSLQIDNYRVIEFSKYFQAPEPVKLEKFVEVESVVGNDDSTYLRIEIFKNECKVDLLKKQITLRNHLELDSYIGRNKEKINKNKIIIKSDSNTPYEIFKPYLEVLKKHEYWTFRLVTN